MKQVLYFCDKCKVEVSDAYKLQKIGIEHKVVIEVCPLCLKEFFNWFKQSMEEEEKDRWNERFRI